MLIRRSPAIVLSLVLGAAALLVVPGAAWSDGGTATDVAKGKDGCDKNTSSRAVVKVGTLENNNARLLVVGTVWSDDSDVWVWKLKHNGDVSDDGRATGDEDTDRAFRIQRTMFNGVGTDDIVFRAENQRTGEVCRATVSY
ncbi:hypothetical protein [Nocardioides mangrovi]|uniref:Secreted protein n=1 Tax=Nocardioides mangrovi TaxID=2874580 RepID=A0ABS7UFS4_9ACTN|nr:hypothetical protein [Nocardioides mangrovi]MBZ5739884.1 hypothetical protein [Nocardioides mangrovi]